MFTSHAWVDALNYFWQDFIYMEEHNMPHIVPADGLDCVVRITSQHSVLKLCRYCQGPLFDKLEMGPDPDVMAMQMHRECINKQWTL